MNQILATENEKNNKNKEQKFNDIKQENTYEPVNNFDIHDEPINNFENSYEPPNYSEQNNYFDMGEINQINNYSKTSKTIDSKKIIMFFAIIIIVFGLAIAGVVGFRMYKKHQIKNSTPEVSIEEIEGNAKISAFCKKGISKVTYYWNEEEKTEIPTTGENVEKLVELPKGENTLTVLLIDTDGNETTYTKSFSYYTDKEKPVIELSIDETSASLKIIATDETEIAEMTYQWNDEEPTVVEAEEEGILTIEENIEIKRGKNTLKITATDTSNNIVTEEKAFNGVNEPEIDFYVKNGYLCITISHDLGIEKIDYTINGKDYMFDETTPTYEQEKLLVKRKIKLQEGENTIEITAYSVEETKSTRKGKHTYTPSN